MNLSLRLQIDLSNWQEVTWFRTQLAATALDCAYPKVLLLFLTVGEVLERQVTVGHKVVGRYRGIVEDGETEGLCVVHIMLERLIPNGIEGLRFGLRTVCNGWKQQQARIYKLDHSQYHDG